MELDVHNTAQPSLATSWEAKPGAAVWVVKLRKGVTFHNGKEMEAADVIYSINHHRGKDSKSGAKASLEQIAELTATDKYELTFTLSAGNADLPYILADYHLGIMPDGAPYDKGIGTGAFILETFEPGQRALTKRNPNYWNPDRGFVDLVETLAINDPTARMSALQSGAVHLVNRVSPKVFDLLKSSPKLATYEISGAAHYTFPMRCDTAPFDNKDVRLALKYAVDREEIIKRVLGGHGKVANDQPIASFDPFYAADLPQHSYDPDKARFHMKQAGFDGTDSALGRRCRLRRLHRRRRADAGLRRQGRHQDRRHPRAERRLLGQCLDEEAVVRLFLRRAAHGRSDAVPGL